LRQLATISTPCTVCSSTSQTMSVLVDYQPLMFFSLLRRICGLATSTPQTDAIACYCKRTIYAPMLAPKFMQTSGDHCLAAMGCLRKPWAKAENSSSLCWRAILAHRSHRTRPEPAPGWRLWPTDSAIEPVLKAPPGSQILEELRCEIPLMA
jgi:hypothetical protein